MITLLPHPNMACSAMVLSRPHLRVQVIDAQRILAALATPTGLSSHQAVRMWAGHAPALRLYHDVCVREQIRRGGRVAHTPQRLPPLETIVMPSWLGDEEIHASHRATLLARDWHHYGRLGWTERPVAGGYVWPEV